MNWIKTAWRKLKDWYEGARYTTDRPYIPGGAPQDPRFDADEATRLTLVRKARYFEKNNALVNKMADLFESYVVGPGLQIQPISDSPDWNAKASEWWKGWERYPDIRSLQNFGTLQGLIARTWFIDGECFIRKVVGESGRPRVQVMEGHAVETPPAMKDDINVIDGIRVDKNGRPVAYYVKQAVSRSEFTYEPVPAREIIHVFEPSRPGQYRGLPFCYPVINVLHDLALLQSLEMGAAKDAASRTNVIKRQGGSLNATALRQARLTETRTLNTGSTASESKAEYYRDVTGAAPIVLQPGDDFQQFKSDRPSVVTRDYWRYLSELACTGCGFPLVLVFPDSMQGTVYRGSLDMAASFFRARFEVMSTALQQVYDYVMGWAANGGERTLRDRPGNFYKIAIHPPRAVNVDVGRNSSAMIAELEAGLTTMATEYGKLGQDWRAALDQRAEEIKYFQDTIGPRLVSGEKPEQPDKATSADDSEPRSATKEDLATRINAYGIAVRAGTITPTSDDENAWRDELGLPAMNEDVKRAWGDDDNTRRPITLTQPAGEPRSATKPESQNIQIITPKPSAPKRLNIVRDDDGRLKAIIPA